MDERSGSSASHAAGRSGFPDGRGSCAAAYPDDEILAPALSRRNKKSGGCNMRKSLAWNQAFFTEEGVLDPMELSLLSGSASEPSADVMHSISRDIPSPVVCKSFSSRPPLHSIGENVSVKTARNLTKDTKACGLFPKSEASSHGEPQECVATGKINPAKGIPKSIPQSPSSYSQKRTASMITVNPTSKLPKVLPAKPHASSLTSTSRNTLLATKSTKSFQSERAVNIDLSVGARNASSVTKRDFCPSSSSSKSSGLDYEKNMASLVERSSDKLMKVADLSVSTKSQEPTISNGSDKRKSMTRVVKNPTAVINAKPSALRMPSPSLGFFCQGKISPTYSTESHKHIQPSEPRILSSRKATDRKSLREVMPLPVSTVQQLPKGTTKTGYSARSVSSRRRKSCPVKGNMELIQMDTTDNSDRITSGSCDFQTEENKQLHSDSLSVGINTNGQSRDISLRKPEPTQVKKPFPVTENMELIQMDTTNQSDNVASGSCVFGTDENKQLHYDILSVGANTNDQSRDISLEKPDPTQVKEPSDNESTISQTNEMLLVEKRDIINQIPETSILENVPVPNLSLGSDVSAISSSGREIDLSQIGGNFGGDKMIIHQEQSCLVVINDMAAAQNSFYGPDLGIELGLENTDLAVSVESESVVRSIKEQIGDNVSCANAIYQQVRDPNQLKEGGYDEYKQAKKLHVGNTGNMTSAVPSMVQPTAQNSYTIPDSEYVLAPRNSDCVASSVDGSCLSLTEEQTGGTFNGIDELNDYLHKKTSIIAQTSVALPACTTSGLSGTFPEESQASLSEDKDIRQCKTLIDPNSDGSSTKRDNVNPDVVLLKNKVNAPPFSEEWLAALEDFGEDILQLKSGPVQNSPRDKALPEPGPWSPVKRKAQEIGPFDCTKYLKNPSASDTP